MARKKSQHAQIAKQAVKTPMIYILYAVISVSDKNTNFSLYFDVNLNNSWLKFENGHCGQVHSREVYEGNFGCNLYDLGYWSGFFLFSLFFPFLDLIYSRDRALQLNQKCLNHQTNETYNSQIK